MSEATAPTHLHVVMLDTYRTEVGVAHLNEYVPAGRRLVTITLTDEQRAALRPYLVGKRGAASVWEEVGQVWLEAHDE